VSHADDEKLLSITALNSQFTSEELTVRQIRQIKDKAC